jgi:hypothetical protein
MLEGGEYVAMISVSVSGRTRVVPVLSVKEHPKLVWLLHFNSGAGKYVSQMSVSGDDGDAWLFTSKVIGIGMVLSIGHDWLDGRGVDDVLVMHVLLFRWAYIHEDRDGEDLPNSGRSAGNGLVCCSS